MPPFGEIPMGDDPPASRGEAGEGFCQHEQTEVVIECASGCNIELSRQPVAQEPGILHRDDPHDGHGCKAFVSCLEDMYRRGRAEADEHARLPLLAALTALEAKLAAAEQREKRLREAVEYHLTYYTPESFVRLRAALACKP